MGNIKLNEVQKIIDTMGITDGLLLVKNGIIEVINSLDFGEINIKFHDNKIKQIDITDRKKY